jgi:hypothetical protein
MPLLVDYEASAAWPLMLDPFLLSEGQLFWRDLDDQDVWAPDIDIMMLSGQAS